MLIPTSNSICLNISSNAAMNITGDRVYVCRYTFHILYFSAQRLICAFVVPPSYISLKILMHISFTLWCFSASKTASCWIKSKASRFHDVNFLLNWNELGYLHWILYFIYTDFYMQKDLWNGFILRFYCIWYYVLSCKPVNLVYLSTLCYSAGAFI